MSTNTTVPTSPAAWKAALDSLPATPNDIPAFFFAHGSPMLAFPKGARTGLGVVEKWVGPDGELANFLRAFGPTLLKKYQPKGIVVFSAHWETSKERLVTDYGDENPLLMDYFGFPRQLYEIKFKSKGDSALSHKVVQLFKDAGIRARTSSVDEKRGSDGRGFSGPGLDHGVFVPFRLMFTDELKNVPVVQASIDASMDPEDNYKLGKAVTKLRKEGILVLAGGLPIHNLGDIMCFHPDTARPAYIEFNKAIVEAIQIQESEQRFKALKALMSHKAFRLANPTPEHFVPLYIAAGAGEGGKVQVLNAMYGIPTVAFGL